MGWIITHDSLLGTDWIRCDDMGLCLIAPDEGQSVTCKGCARTCVFYWKYSRIIRTPQAEKQENILAEVSCAGLAHTICCLVDDASQHHGRLTEEWRTMPIGEFVEFLMSQPQKKITHLARARGPEQNMEVTHGT